MSIWDCNFLKKIPDLSSSSNLKELGVHLCRRLVEVHDSVGYLENLSKLRISECNKLRILPRSLKLSSLRVLQVRKCSSLRNLPEIECKMESLTHFLLSDVAIEELPLSVRYLTGLQRLCLSYCTNLVHLLTTCIQLPLLWQIEITGCPNLVTNKRDCELSLLPIESAAMEDEITSTEEQLHELEVPTNSSKGSTASLQVSNPQISCSQSESSFFPLYSFFSMLNSSSTLGFLKLSEIEIVSIPTSIIGFVKLRALHLEDCKKLEEIPELPPNLEKVLVRGCKSLERFQAVSSILEFNGIIPSPKSITFDGCDKMQENIWNWNDKVQNPLLWKGLYYCDATLFPKRNHTPKWFSYVYDFFEDNEMVKGPDDDVRLWRKEEWAIDIEGPHHLDEISGILLYTVLFSKAPYIGWTIGGNAKITSNSSNHVCHIPKGLELEATTGCIGPQIGYYVEVGFSNLQSFKLKVLDNLRVQFHPYSARVPVGFYPAWVVPFYGSCRAKIVYKNERRENKRKRKMNHQQFNLRTWRRLFYRSCRAKILYKNESRAKKRKRNGKMDVADVAKSHDDH